MAELTIVSGVGGKLPAAFLLEIDGKRLLLDLGEGPEAGVLPDVSGIGKVDAICLSHAHIDHVGGLVLRSLIGNPPVYATQATWSEIPETLVPQDDRHIVPVKGAADIAGVPVRLGRSGHAPGGVWLHFGGDDGFLYTGDWSSESSVFAFDRPPRARVVVTDASYGDRSDNLSDQIEAIAEAVADGGVLPVPAFGRGPEMALRLAALGLRPKLCPVVAAELRYHAGDESGGIEKHIRSALHDLLANGLKAGPVEPGDVVIATDSNCEGGYAAGLLQRRDEGFRFVFTGHVPRGTPAASLLARDEAQWLPWNVHPRLQDTLDLIAWTQCEILIPAFVKADSVGELERRAGAEFFWGRSVRL